MKKYHVEYATPEMVKDHGGLHDLSWEILVMRSTLKAKMRLLN